MRPSVVAERDPGPDHPIPITTPSKTDAQWERHRRVGVRCRFGNRVGWRRECSWRKHLFVSFPECWSPRSRSIWFLYGAYSGERAATWKQVSGRGRLLKHALRSDFEAPGRSYRHRRVAPQDARSRGRPVGASRKAKNAALSPIPPPGSMGSRSFATTARPVGSFGAIGTTSARRPPTAVLRWASTSMLMKAVGSRFPSTIPFGIDQAAGKALLSCSLPREGTRGDLGRSAVGSFPGADPQHETHLLLFLAPRLIRSFTASGNGCVRWTGPFAMSAVVWPSRFTAFTSAPFETRY